MSKILIVEDDQIVAHVYGNRFSREGFQVKIAPDGEAGLALVHSFRPDAVILDLMLPKLSGVELTKRIRAEAGGERLPIIVFSNAYMTSMMHQAEKAGATKCLSKAAWMPEQVAELVRSLLPADAPSAVVPRTPVGAAAPAHTPSIALATAAGSEPAASGEPDAAFRAAQRRSFFEGLPATLATVRTLLQALFKAEDETARLAQIHELYGRVHALTGNAIVAGVPQIARLSDALEALLKALHEKPKSIIGSALHTIALAMDFLGSLREQDMASDELESPTSVVLVVDDEIISARAVTYALDKAKLKSVTIKDPAAAYELLARDRFDLIVLDVDMPGMSGYELCTRLRALPEHKHTPVVFVTGLNDFNSRANSTVSGGNDFITKPFLFIELAVKALVYVYRHRLQPGVAF
jgi:DNA-binding response OmpR family regulator